MNLCIGRHGERSDYLEKIHAGFSGQVAVYIRSWGEITTPLITARLPFPTHTFITDHEQEAMPPSLQPLAMS